MSKKVRTLLRVSSKQQLHEGDIPVQRAEAEQYIARQSDWVFDKEYIEKAVSAYKNSVEDREVLQKILADARAGEFNILLAYMSDRIGRQEEYSFYVAALNQLGIEVWTIKDGQLKTREHTDKLLNFIRFWQNEGESRKTSMRVKDARREMVKAGKFPGGRAPYGYKLVPSGMVNNHGRLLKKLEIVEKDAAVVKKIYDLAILKGMGYEKIARTLNDEGILSAAGSKWKPTAIAGILKNPIYMGVYAINKRGGAEGTRRMDRREWIYSEKQIPELVIIPKSAWEKAQEIREERIRKLNTSKEQSLKLYEDQYKVPFTTRGKLALMGLVYCGYCGKKLKNGSYCNHWTVKSGKKKVSFTGRYICPNQCMKRKSYGQDYLESIVFQVAAACIKQLKGIDFFEDLEGMRQQEKAGFKRELKQIEKQIQNLNLDLKTLEEKIPEAIRGEYYFSAEKLSELIKEKADCVDKLKEREKEVRSKAARAENHNDKLKNSLEMKPDLGITFESADTQTKRMLLFYMIDQVIVKDDDVKIKLKIGFEDFIHETPGFAVPEQGL